MADAVGKRLSRVDGVREIHSPATSSLLVPNEDGFAVRRSVEKGRPVPDASQLAIRAMDDPLWLRNLISEDGTVGAVIVHLRDSKSETMVRVVEAVHSALAPFEAEGFEFHLVGHPIESVVPGQQLADSMAALTPFVAIIVALTIFALTGSWRSVAITMGVMGVALLWTFGLLGWLDWPRDSVLEILANLILVVGVCDAIHILSRNAAVVARRGGAVSREQRTQAILEAAREVGRPCLLTTLTTGGAFLSFVTSDLATFVRFGLISAFGIGACLALTFTLLPLLACWLPGSEARAERGIEAWDAVLRAIARTADRRAIPILAGTLVIFVICSVGWFGYLRVDTDINKMWGEHSSVTRWIRFVDDNLRGLDTLEIDIALPVRSPIEDPETQRVVSQFSQFLATTEGLGPTTSVQDLISRVNRVLHDDDPAFERTGDTAAANAEILELISFDDPEVLDSWLSFDRSHLRISVEGPSDSARGRGQVLEVVREYVELELPEDWEITLTGPFAMEFDWVTQIQETQIRSFVTAFAIVFILVACFLRSIRLALAAMVPALVPVVVILGVMGLSGLYLDVGRAMLAAIVLGIAVDDSIHLLSHYKYRRDKGDTPAEAIRDSILHVGRAVVVTSAALALGLLTLVASAWQTISSFGFFVSVALTGALVASLFVLPAIFFAFQRRESPPQPETNRSSAPARRPGKTLLLSLALLPVAGALAGAGALTVQGERTKELPCWILPNGLVPPFSGIRDACPLQHGDELRSIQLGESPPLLVDGLRSLNTAIETANHSARVTVIRGEQQQSFAVPVREVSAGTRLARLGSAALIAGVLLFVPILLLYRSPSPAAAPLAFFYAAVAVLIVTAICGSNSYWLHRGGVVAGVTAPAALAHLCLVFPREREIARQRPGLALVPYLASALLVPPAWIALERNPAFWPSILHLVIALTAGAWIVLAVSCAFAIRESSSPLERARARVLWYGMLLLPVIPTLALARSRAPEAILTYLGAAAVLMPMPIALAIGRYKLFDLAADARRWVAHGVYFATAALVVSAVFAVAGWQGDWVELFALAFACAVGVEWLRRRLLGLLESRLSPRVSELRELRRGFTQEIGSLREPDEVASLLGETLQRALHAEATCVFLPEGAVWRPAHIAGENAPAQSRLARDALAALGGQPLLHLLANGESGTPAHGRLRDAGVELIARLDHRGQPLGLALLAESRTRVPYTVLDLDFAAMAANQGALALHNAHLAEDLAFAEQQAATTRVALTLVHQVGKELDWIRGLSQRLSYRLSDPHRARRDVESIQELSNDLVHSVRVFLRDATRSAPDRPGVRPLEPLIDRAVLAATRSHGEGRIAKSLDPQLRAVAVDACLERVIASLLDNALHASPAGTLVSLHASLKQAWIEIAVADQGCGMTTAELENAFELGFTTRPDRGSGVGLALSKETVESLGGTIHLDSHPGGGTRASVRVALRS